MSIVIPTVDGRTRCKGVEEDVGDEEAERMPDKSVLIRFIRRRRESIVWFIDVESERYCL